jgi:hypothetical protein
VSAPVDILAVLTAYNAQAVIEQGRVRLLCRDPLPAELIEAARAHKDQLRALLEARRDRLEERAAILEFDEGLPRAKAETIAHQETAAAFYDDMETLRTAAGPYSSALRTLGVQCPDDVPEVRWQQAIADATAFISEWGAQAHAFRWSEHELFGLHPVPERPAASYRRLSRYDETGLIWLLRGRPVVALTETTAAIQGAAAIMTYRKLNKPALGPLGDSLDDLGPCA